MLDSTKCRDFVQVRPERFCQSAWLFQNVSEEKGYKVKCRDPRCSLPCRNAWAEKESAIIEHVLHMLPRRFNIFRGNLVLWHGADHADHASVKARFARLMASAVEKLGGVFEFVGIADHTRHPDGTFDRHWDLSAFSDLKRSQIRQIKRDVARKLCNEFGRPVKVALARLKAAEIHARSRYLVKAEKLGETRYIYLPARDGSRLVWSSGGFFGPKSKEQVWQELIALWNAQRNALPKQKVEVGTGIWIFDVLQCEWWEVKAVVELRPETARPITYSNISTTTLPTKLNSILPRKGTAAVSLAWMAWMTGAEVGDLLEALPGVPGVQQAANGGYWLEGTPKRNDQPQLYHKDYVQEVVDWDKEVHKVVQPYQPVMSEAEFLAALRSLKED